MAHNSTVQPEAACNLPSATLSGTECAPNLSLMDMLDHDVISGLLCSSIPAFGEHWPLAALLAPSTEFDFLNCAPNAHNFTIPSTQNDFGGQACPHYSPRLVPSPASSFSSFGLEHSFDDMFASIPPVLYSGVAFPSPATMGHDISFPYLMGLSPPTGVLALSTHGTLAHTIPGITSPCSAASSLVCQPVVPVSSTPAQGGSLNQGSLFTCGSCSAAQHWQSSSSSFPINPSDLHPSAVSYPLPASTPLAVHTHQESHSPSKQSGDTTLPRSAPLPESLSTNGIVNYQVPSSVEDTTTSFMHPSLAQPVPELKVTIDSSSPQLRAPCVSTPTSPQTDHRKAEPTSATSATSSPSDAIFPFGITTNALNTPPASDVADDPAMRSAPPGMRIRKTGLKRTHSCDQCSQSYVRAEHLRRHIKSKHMGLKEHVCDLCDFRCSRSDNLRQHRRTMHDA